MDFGLSNTFKSGETLKTACGSPCYAAPEMISGQVYKGTCVDVWSCGVVLFALLNGFLPFEDPETSELYAKILAADYQMSDHVSDEAADLIRRILTTDPEKRITIPEIKRHPWFNIVPYTLPGEPGVFVGTDCPPVDTSILKKMHTDFGHDPLHVLKCLEANSHNSLFATYFLLLK